VVLVVLVVVRRRVVGRVCRGRTHFRGVGFGGGGGQWR